MFGVGVGIRVGGFTPSSGGGGLNPDAQAFITATGITNPTEISAINTLVNDLQGYGLWSKMKALYPFVTDNRNLLSYTEDFGNAYWSKSGATVTTNDITAPNGTLTADKVVFNTSNNYMQGAYTNSYNLGNCYHSIWVKGTAGETIYFDDGYVAIPNVTLTGNWQQVEFYSNRNTQNQGIGIGTYNGATARTVWLWGAQVSVGSSPVTYQPIATTQQAFISNQFKYNLKNPVDSDAAFRLVFNGGWTFASTGATPNGVNGYADTFLTPSLTTNIDSFSMGSYWRTNSQNGGYQGAKHSSLVIYSIFRNSDSTIYLNGSFVSTTAPSNLTGFKSINRNNTTKAAIWINSTKYEENYTTVANIDMQLYIASVNGFSSYMNNQFAFHYISDGLTDTEASNFYTAVQTYQTALSRQV